MSISKTDVRFNWLSIAIFAIAIALQIVAFMFIGAGIQEPGSSALSGGSALSSIAILTAVAGFFAGLALNRARRRKRR